MQAQMKTMFCRAVASHTPLAVLAGFLLITLAAHPPLGRADPPEPSSSSVSAEKTPALLEKIAAGKEVYGRTCIACHQPDGQGIPMAFPPLAGSDYLVADVDRAIRGVLKGQQGEMVVKGQKFNMIMPPQMLSDTEIAQVVTYVLNSFGNPGGEVTAEHVAEIRGE